MNELFRKGEDFLADDSGISTIELVIIFKSSINGLLNTIFKQIKSQAGEVYKK